VYISIKRRDKSFRIFWLGSISDKETYEEGNKLYSFAFLSGSIIIMSVEVLTAYFISK
jgi:hypothetical protein